MSNFTIAPIPEKISNGISIYVKVRGFWSSSTITIYLNRNWVYDGVWNVDISTSSGGRDTNEVKTDAEAYSYYAEALTAAVELARNLESRFPEFEANYQVEREIAKQLREKAEEDRKLEEAKNIANSSAIGYAVAKDLVKQIKMKSNVTFTMRNRATQATMVYEFYRSFRTNLGRVIKVAEMIDIIANAEAGTFSYV